GVVWIEERAAREIRHVRAPRAGGSPFGRSRTQPEEQLDEGAVASPPAQFRIVRVRVIGLRASVGNPASGNSDEPSGKYVYITRLPYECQTKLPNTSDTDWGPYAIGIRAGYDPNSPGQSQGAASARQERRLHDDFRRDSRGDRSFHRREVRAGLHPQAHDRTAKRECRRSPAAREVGRLRVCRGRGPQRGPGVCPTSAPQGHGRGRAIGRRGGNARPPGAREEGGPRRGRPAGDWRTLRRDLGAGTPEPDWRRRSHVHYGRTGRGHGDGSRAPRGRVGPGRRECRHQPGDYAIPGGTRTDDECPCGHPTTPG